MKLEINAVNKDEAGVVSLEISSAVPHVLVTLNRGNFVHHAFLAKEDALLLGQFLVNLALKMEGKV